MAFELLVGRAPFESKTREQTYANIIYKEPKFPNTLSDGAKSFIKRTLSKVRQLLNLIATFKRAGVGCRGKGKGEEGWGGEGQFPDTLSDGARM